MMKRALTTGITGQNGSFVNLIPQMVALYIVQTLKKVFRIKYERKDEYM